MNSKFKSEHQLQLAESNGLKLKIQDHAVSAHLWMTCLNCIMWDKKHGACAQFGAVPPPHIIVSGCPDHDYDIPF